MRSAALVLALFAGASAVHPPTGGSKESGAAGAAKKHEEVSKHEVVAIEVVKPLPRSLTLSALPRRKRPVSTAAAPPPPPTAAGAPRLSVEVEAAAPVEVAAAAPPAAAPQPVATSGAAAVVAEVKEEVQEAKVQRANIAELEQALKANVALLRESSVLQRMSQTPRTRKAAMVQVRRAEQVVKDVGSILKGSRSAAVQEAQGMLRQADEVAAAAAELRAAAHAQLRLLGAAAAPPAAAEVAPVLAAPEVVSASVAAFGAVPAFASPSAAAAEDADADDDIAESL
mmetsp:Transcript_166935/g.535910  ORF Transcript_166935/g.535910 Transcript_166935/m.535910 type:complete len:285 (+) Transcript_166935:78-932(+)